MVKLTSNSNDLTDEEVRVYIYQRAQNINLVSIRFSSKVPQLIPNFNANYNYHRLNNIGMHYMYYPLNHTIYYQDIMIL